MHNHQAGARCLPSRLRCTVHCAGPFYITQQNGAPSTPHFTWDQMYGTDLANYTTPDGGQPSPQELALVQGGEVRPGMHPSRRSAS